VGFNLGMEVGQLTVVLGIVWVLVRLRLALPRPIVADVTSSLPVGWRTIKRARLILFQQALDLAGTELGPPTA
jgi:hypothetical protein